MRSLRSYILLQLVVGLWLGLYRPSITWNGDDFLLIHKWGLAIELRHPLVGLRVVYSDHPEVRGWQRTGDKIEPHVSWSGGRGVEWSWVEGLFAGP
jgi:hypothetical protein